nr:hypothetical protein [Tanacetum cinerariifolium]
YITQKVTKRDTLKKISSYVWLRYQIAFPPLECRLWGVMPEDGHGRRRW